MQLTDTEWKQKLTPEQYAVLREGATEQAFTGALLQNKNSGDYVCAACGAILFDSNTKFESGSGWPSFYDVSKSDAVTLKVDSSHGMERTEAVCTNCGGHLGHVFHDAPDQPTGMRFCINSAALDFKPKGKS
ncbi:MAG: peptide-methionine (R)-S-oxide reductase MsrB [bacterium]|nr:peptide-methionine (R)-S-oxide reductase MsrB [bacterium]